MKIKKEISHEKMRTWESKNNDDFELLGIVINEKGLVSDNVWQWKPSITKQRGPFSLGKKLDERCNSDVTRTTKSCISIWNVIWRKTLMSLPLFYSFGKGGFKLSVRKGTNIKAYYA